MTVIRKTALAGAMVALTALPVAAAECPLSYEQFEVGVPHTDMETCPESMAQEGTYCRLSLVAETVTIFAFAESNDCIVATKTYADEDFSLKVD
ncbi:MAG: hypothetical protein AAFV19_23920 [Pseudomonadota bacterium]